MRARTGAVHALIPCHDGETHGWPTRRHRICLTFPHGCIDICATPCHDYYMNSNEKPEIKFTTSKRGQKRAYQYSWGQFRWFPMALDEAELLVTTGQAEDFTGKAHL